MGIFQFYNLRKPKAFNYKPLYTDEKKEELKRKVEKARRELSGDDTLRPEDVKENIRGSFHQASKHLRKYANDPEASKKRNSRTWVLILVAVLLAVLFVYMYLR
ncbi:hypothetical protein [Porphyromonas sp.]|uniref:hypothetical protein n=1 Tax=Porphyromonas sp. TaxID=1924944 RepID=UPI0026DB4805|nr:hypothetical protein [Porphyromonas sp.]MDO4695727.1 hypothetical protein [Porphyromonas sp.]MDO4771747.1 hypothetical protein [Porphyromonas sp.]